MAFVLCERVMAFVLCERVMAFVLCERVMAFVLCERVMTFVLCERVMTFVLCERVMTFVLCDCVMAFVLCERVMESSPCCMFASGLSTVPATRKACRDGFGSQSAIQLEMQTRPNPLQVPTCTHKGDHPSQSPPSPPPPPPPPRLEYIYKEWPPLCVPVASGMAGSK